MFQFELIGAAQLGVMLTEHSLAAKSVQIRTSSGKCNKPASAVFARGHGLMVSKPNPGSLSSILSFIRGLILQ